MSVLNPKHGINLTEIMIAMFIVAVSFLPVIGTLGTSIKATGKEDDLNRAMNLCQSKLNTALTLPFDYFATNELLGVGEIGSTISPGSGEDLMLGSEMINGVTFRSTLQVTAPVGSFTVPELNFDATDYDDEDHSTWSFVPKQVSYEGLVHLYVMKVHWISKGETQERFYTLATYRAKLREDP